MKTQILLFSTLFIALIARAQSPLLVGMTINGGSNNTGTIMQYTGGTNGVSQVANLDIPGYARCTLTEAPNGKMYGLTQYGGTDSVGSFIEYDYPTNTYTILASFDSATGTQPQGSLVLAGDGLLYGLTSAEGANGGGTLFSYTIGASMVIKLVDLPANANPVGALMQSADGNLYGMTHDDGAYGSGTIFRYLISSSTYSPIYTLRNHAWPIGSLLETSIDTFYGITDGDPSLGIAGSIFSYEVVSNNFTTLYTFPFLQSFVSGSLIRATDGLLYGTTSGDGISSYGTIFRFNIGLNAYGDLHNFAGGTDGLFGAGDLYQASDEMLYGMTRQGGSNNSGIIFRYDITSATYSVEVSLDAASGDNPWIGHFTEYNATSGAHDLSALHFSLSPNPTSGSFTITNNYPGTHSVNVISILGERLKTYTMTGSTQAFDISDLAAGIYEVQISDANQTLKVMKVVKE